MEIQVRVCDIDPVVGRPTRSYTITQCERVVHLDLCEEHAVELERLLSVHVAPLTSEAIQGDVATTRNVPAVERPKPSPRQRRSETKVMTMTEIEALKASQRGM